MFVGGVVVPQLLTGIEVAQGVRGERVGTSSWWWRWWWWWWCWWWWCWWWFGLMLTMVPISSGGDVDSAWLPKASGLGNLTKEMGLVSSASWIYLKEVKESPRNVKSSICFTSVWFVRVIPKTSVVQDEVQCTSVMVGVRQKIFPEVRKWFGSVNKDKYNDNDNSVMISVRQKLFPEVREWFGRVISLRWSRWDFYVLTV